MKNAKTWLDTEAYQSLFASSKRAHSTMQKRAIPIVAMNNYWDIITHLKYAIYDQIILRPAEDIATESWICD